MEDLFRSYWWLLFPLAWFVFGGFSSALNYYKQKNVLKLIKTYADKGQQPPETLLKVLERPIDEDADDWRDGRSGRLDNGHWFSVVLFGIMALGFGYASATDLYGAGEAFLIVAFVMGALAAASLTSALLNRRSRR